MIEERVTERLEVFADISCPFTHVGLRRLVTERERRGRSSPRLHVRAWPLELVNGEPLAGAALEPKVEALRATVAPELFTGFSPRRFPQTTLPALAAEAAAQALDPVIGERLSLRLRTVLFEEGRDPSDPKLLAELLAEHGVDPSAVHPSAVEESWREGERRGVVGSPFFYVGSAGWFCPSLAITHDDTGYDISIDTTSLEGFLESVFPEP
jgi:predicted DsbA family dithiol-disulfide isomerase